MYLPERWTSFPFLTQYSKHYCMKKLLFIIASIGCMKVHATNTAEHPESKKSTRKNLIEIGWSAGWLFNNKPLTFQKYGGLMWLPIETADSRILPSYIKYSRCLSLKTMLSFSMHSFGVYYPEVIQNIKMSQASKGKITTMFFDDFTLGVEYNFRNKRLTRQLTLRNNFSAGISYRDGFVLVSGKGYPEGYAEYYKGYSSMGLGVSSSFDLVVSNRFFIGGLIGYTHYFENGFLDKDAPEYFDSYTPIRHVLRVHPKIGVLF